MLFREMTAVFSCETHKCPVGKIQVSYVKAGGKHSYHCALNNNK
jgi:hypothetical protein